jgi:hypothetical protein
MGYSIAKEGNIMLDLITLAKKYIPISIEWQSKPTENSWDKKTI